MVEVAPEYLKPGHRFDTSPFLLDLYRLFGIVLGDRPLPDAATVLRQIVSISAKLESSS
jgi:hypothetical protein